MKIAVIDFAASVSGAASVLVSFYDYLIKTGDKNEWYFFVSENFFEETENIHVILKKKEKKSWIRRLLYDYVYGRKDIKKISPDAVFSLQNTVIHGACVPQIVFLHQSIPFQKGCNFSFFKPEERRYAVYQHIIGRIIKASCKKADHVIVQADWLKRAVVNDCKVSSEKILVAPPVVDVAERKDDGVTFCKTKFFYPAGGMLYKNHRCIREAMKLLDFKEGEIEVTLTVSEEKYGESDKRVKCVGLLPHKEVIEMLPYQTLIFPSYIEASGVPMAESRAAGGLVLASDTEFSHDMLGDYPNAYYFDPFCPVRLAELMRKVVNSEIAPIDVPSEKKEKTDIWASVIKCIFDHATLK